MGFYDCIGAVASALGRQVTMSEFDALYTRLLEERDGLFAQGYPADWLAAARVVAKQIEIEKAIAQRQVIRNRMVYGDLTGFLAAARGTVDAGRALEARLVGINTPVEGGRKSIAAEAHALWTTAAGALLADLRRAAGGTDRLVKLLSEPSFEIEIAKALRGETAHADAMAIGKAIESAREDLRRQENDAGGWRGKLDGYVTRQSHDSQRVRRAGYDKWKADVLPRLDAGRTFTRQEELRQQLRHEAGQVRLQLEAGQAELRELAANFTKAGELDKRAEGRGRKLDRAMEESRKRLGAAIGGYLDAQQKIGGTDLEVREARAELQAARYQLKAEADKASAVRQLQPELRERIRQERALFERAEKGVELLDALAARLHEYQARVQGAVDPDTFLRRIYNAIAADTWMRGSSEEFRGLLAEIGPSNIARRRAAHRELHFKSAEDEVAYMRQYGAGGVADTVLRELEGAGSAIALMRGLGTNPEAMFQLVRTDLLKEARDTGNHALAQAVSRRSLDWQLAEVTGASRQVANPTIAAWAGSVRVVQSIAKLGGAMLSSFGDVATAAAELRYQGRGALDAYADMLGGMMKGRREGEKRIVADLLGVGFESLSGHILSRLGGESAPPGGLAKAAALFFRLNGLSWWTDTHKTTAGLVTARYFAHMTERPHGELPAPTQRLLAQYGIDRAGWEILRKAELHATDDGAKFLTPEGVRGTPLDLFLGGAMTLERGAGLSERAMREARDRLATAYATLVTDRVDFAVVTPGARERAYLNMGTQRGDILGEALRFVTQFKSFSVAMVTKSIGRDFNGQGGSKLSATMRTMTLAFQLAVFGYLSMSAKDMIAGKNPRDPHAPETWAAALMQGGGAGILGDFAFGQFNRFGQSALATAAGPTFGTVDSLFQMWATAHDPKQIERGKVGHAVAAEGLRTLASNTPFASMWWLRPAVNYLALWPVQEALSPGYLHRLEKRIRDDNKQTYWLSPEATAPRF